MKRLLLGAVLLLLTTTAIAATPLYGSKMAVIRNWPATIPAETTLTTPTEESRPAEGSEQEGAKEPTGVDITQTEATPNDIASAETTPTEEGRKEDSEAVEGREEVVEDEDAEDGMKEKKGLQ